MEKFDMQTAPVGYVGVTNRKSLFGGERKSALVSEDVLGNNSQVVEIRETATIPQGKTLENSFYTPSYEEVIKKPDVRIIDIEIPTSDKMDNEDFDKWEEELVSATKKLLGLIKY